MGNCPANVDARGQSYFLAEEKVAEAYELVRDRNIMPGVLGRICHHPCESACKRNYYDEPIAIRPLHRVAFERYAEVREERVKPLPKTRDQRVAIIGSGPSGLSAAYDLMRNWATRSRSTRRTTTRAARCSRACLLIACRARCSSRRSTTSSPWAWSSSSTWPWARTCPSTTSSASTTPC